MGWLRSLCLKLTAVSMGLVLCEIILSAAAVVFPVVAFHLKPVEFRLVVDGNELVAPREIVPDPVLGYRLSPYSGRFDKWGYRNPGVPDSCEVLALGDSMTFGHDVAAKESWPHGLSVLGEFCVYNAGVGGYGPAEYRVVLEETQVLRPRLVVIGLTLGNDIHDAFRSTYLRAGKPFRHLQNADPAVVAEVLRLERNESLSARTLRLLGNLPELITLSREEGGGLRQWLASKSSLYALAREVKRVLVTAQNAARVGAPAVAQGEKNLDSFESSTNKPQRFAWTHNPPFRTVFVNPEIINISMDLDDPRIREGKRITESVLIAIRDRLARDDIALLVLIIPTKESAYSALLDPERDRLPQSILQLLVTEERLRQEIIAFLKASEIAFLDTLPALQASFAAGAAAFHQSDDGHPNGTGQAIIARALLPAVQQQLANAGAGQAAKRSPVSVPLGGRKP